MALGAVLGQRRADLRLEEGDLLRRGGPVGVDRPGRRRGGPLRGAATGRGRLGVVLKLLEAQRAVAVGVDAVEERADQLASALQPRAARREGAELGAAEPAVAVVVAEDQGRLDREPG